MAEDAAIGAELAAPERVHQHDHARAALHVVLAGEPAADRGLYSGPRVEAPGNRSAPAFLRVRGEGEGGSPAAISHRLEPSCSPGEVE